MLVQCSEELAVPLIENEICVFSLYLSVSHLKTGEIAFDADDPELMTFTRGASEQICCVSFIPRAENLWQKKATAKFKRQT
jgi:hypothetical protein